jgi:hypothetical protein
MGGVDAGLAPHGAFPTKPVPGKPDTYDQHSRHFRVRPQHHPYFLSFISIACIVTRRKTLAPSQALPGNSLRLPHCQAARKC